jgi:hypothetical protein
MNGRVEAVRSLEQQESGEIRRFRCSACAQPFSSVEQLARHESVCGSPVREARKS